MTRPRIGGRTGPAPDAPAPEAADAPGSTESPDWFRLAHVIQRVGRLVDVSVARGVDVPPMAPVTREVLSHVLDHPACRVQDIADALMLPASNASAAVTHLVGLGLVEKTPDPDDRRVVRVGATDLARSQRRGFDAAWARVYREAAQSLDAEDLATLLGAVPALERLAAQVVTRGHA